MKHSLSLTGFTLIELMIVIVIILILVTMSVVSVQALRERARIDATRGLIGKIEIALRTYKETFLAFPPSESDTPTYGHLAASQNLWYYLYQGSADEVDNDASPTCYSPGLFVKVIRPPDLRTQEPGIYKRVTPAIGPEGFKGREIDAEHNIIDAWGTPLYYKNPGEDHRPAAGANYRGRNNSSYVDLESAGPHSKGPSGSEELIFDDDDSPDDNDINNWKEKK